MLSEDALNLKRRKILADAGERTEVTYKSLGIEIEFLSGTHTLDGVVENYLKLRNEFAQKHEIRGLMANHKVAALYVWALIDREAEEFFLFKDSSLGNQTRLALVTFMYYVIYGILCVDKKAVDTELQEDIAYCLLMEPPQSIEWLCLTMHALCRYRGLATNTHC